MKLLPALFSLFLNGVSLSLAGNLTINSNAGLQVRDSSGALISGGAIRVGFLNLESPRDFITENASDFAQIDAYWTPLAEGSPNGGTVAQAGNTGQTLIVNDQFLEGDFFGQITNVASLPQGTKLFLWLFNDADPSEASEWAIVSSSDLSWSVPSAIGSTTLSTNDVDQIFRGSRVGNEIRLSPKESPSGFDAWAVASFNFAQLADGEADFSADPDGDGWTNATEYVFGTPPLVSSTPGARFGIEQSDEAEFSLVYRPLPGRSDVQISGETSSDLRGWSPANASEITPGTFAISLPSGNGTRAFARLKFSRP